MLALAPGAVSAEEPLAIALRRRGLLQAPGPGGLDAAGPIARRRVMLQALAPGGSEAAGGDAAASGAGAEAGIEVTVKLLVDSAGDVNVKARALTTMMHASSEAGVYTRPLLRSM